MEQSLKREPLGRGVILYTSPEYRFGTDAILLQHFANAKGRDKICDMGCGGGIIPMLFCRDNPKQDVTALDIQEGAISLTRRAAEENGFDNLKPILRDIREELSDLGHGSFDLVTCNPPYKKGGAGIVNPNEARLIARHESECTLTDVCAAAQKLLKSSGRLCMCHRPERLCDCILEMREHKTEPKRLRFVHQRENTEPWLFLIEGKRDAKPGLRISPPLYIEGNDGDLSEEMKSIYGVYKF